MMCTFMGGAGAVSVACVTLMDLPATRMVPLAIASHEQPAWVVTVSVPEPPEAVAVRLPGLTV
jgi:hypothetical protein